MRLIRRNKMVEISFRTLKIKVLVFTISNPLSTKIRGRHSTTDIPYSNYNRFLLLVQVKIKLPINQAFLPKIK